MRDAKRAVDAVAVLDGRLAVVVLEHVVIVAVIAHEVSTEAVEQSRAAAEHALPVDLCFAVDFTDCLAGADLLQDAILAKKILGLRLVPLSVVHLTLAVDEATEVGLLAVVALVEGATMVGKLLRLLVVYVVNVAQTCILENSLLLSMDQCLRLNLLLETKERSELGFDRLRESLHLDFLLAAGAGHEGEGDSEGGPLVLEEVDDAVRVEDVAAREF